MLCCKEKIGSMRENIPFFKVVTWTVN